MNAKPILIRGARQLLTLRGPTGPRRGDALDQLGIIVDGALLIADGVIHEVGSSRRVENLAEARRAVEINAGRRVVMPGFVDCHAQAISARAADTSPIRGGVPPMIEAILDGVKPVREATGLHLRAEAEEVLGGALDHGTTAMDAKSGFGLNQSGELKILRALAHLRTATPMELFPSVFAAQAVPPEFEGRGREYMNWLCEDLLPLVERRRLARFADVYRGAGGFSAGETAQFLDRARRLGFRTRVATSQFEHDDGVRIAVGAGALSADGLDEADEDDVVALAGSPTMATLTPAATFYRGTGHYAPARDLIGRGAAVALASGYSRATCPCYNMQMAVFLACHRLSMTPAEAVSAATINAAHALEIGGRAGSIEAGKQADVAILAVADYRELAVQFGVNLVSMTLKRGKIVHRSADLT
jgi:imidazolonepropionase